MSGTRKIPRLLWEFLIILIVMALAAGWTWWSGRQSAAEMAVLRQSIEVQREEMQRRLDAAGEELVRAQAEALARGFGAGITPLILAGGIQGADSAVGEILQVPAVVFAHVLEPGGGVIATSDRKLALMGDAGSRAAWALEATQPRSRTDAAGVTEVVVPVGGDPEVSVVLWIGYDANLVAAGGKPDPPQ